MPSSFQEKIPLSLAHMTTTERDADWPNPPAQLLIYNTTTGTIQIYDDLTTTWDDIAYLTSIHAQSHAHSAAADGTTLTPAILNIPAAASPAQTTDGSAVWDSDDNLLTVGDGSSRQTFLPVIDATSDPLIDGDAAADGTEKSVARKDHVHPKHHAKYTDAEAITAVQGEATLDLTGDVTIAAAKSLAVDTVIEKTAAAGVTIDGVLLKDNLIAASAVPDTHGVTPSAHHTRSHTHADAGDGTTLTPALLNLPQSVITKGTSANIDANDEIVVPAVSLLYLTSAGATDSLSGIGAGTDGQIVFLTVVAGKDITLVHNGTVVAGKKLMINGEANVTLDQDHDLAIAIYDATATVWKVLVPGSGGGAAHDHTTGDGSGVLTNDEHDGYSAYTEIVAPGVAGANVLRAYAVDTGGVTALGLSNSAQEVIVKLADWVDLTDGGATTLHAHDHGALGGLADDDHTQYALLAGRAGGQTLAGSTLTGENLTIKGNAADATGFVVLASKLKMAATPNNIITDSSGVTRITVGTSVPELSLTGLTRIVSPSEPTNGVLELYFNGTLTGTNIYGLIISNPFTLATASQNLSLLYLSPTITFSASSVQLSGFSAAATATVNAAVTGLVVKGLSFAATAFANNVACTFSTVYGCEVNLLAWPSGASAALTITNMYGFRSLLRFTRTNAAATTTITTVAAFYADPPTTPSASAGTITNYYQLFLGAVNDTDLPTITTLYGIWVGILGSSSAGGDRYGLKLNDVTSALASTKVAYGIQIDALDTTAPSGAGGAAWAFHYGDVGTPYVTIDYLGRLLAYRPLEGIGYGTGAGGTVTQLTSKATGVALAKVCGAITMHNAALAAGATVTFTVTNTAVIAATDVVVANHSSGGTAGAYIVEVNGIGAGTFNVSVTNHTAGSLSEAIVITFAVLRAVTA